MLQQQHIVEILLVEDNPGDVRLMQEAFKDAKIGNRITVARDGREALAILNGQETASGQNPPDIVMLDLNLPGQNGFEILSTMKASPRLKSIPVVILSGSRAEQDIARSYELNASCYVTKPLDLQQFMEVIRSVEDFSLAVVKQPPNVAS